MLLLSCSMIQSVQAQNWWGKGIKGKGPMVTKTLDLSEISGIALGINAKVYLTQGNRQSVKIEAQENLIEILKTRVSGGTWKIGFHENVSNHKTIKIHITLNTLDKVSVGGSGAIEGTNHFPNIDELDVAVSGSGKIALDVEATEINTAVSGSGKIYLEGSTNKHRIAVSGSGGISAYDLESADCKITISGSGDCKVNVRNDLRATVSGSGDVYYKGNPNIRSKVSGSGDISSRN